MDAVNNNVVIIKSKNDKAILLDYSVNTTNVKRPVIIFAHGYKGFKDWGAWPLLLEELAAEGFVALKFNFSLNGTTAEHPVDFVDLEAFGNSTYSQEQYDLQAVVEFAVTLPGVDPEQVYLMGHSRGGGSVLLQAFTNAAVKGVISLAGVADFKKRFPQRENFKKWKKEGVFHSLNGRTKQLMPHYFVFWEDFEKNEEQLTIQYAAQHLKKPMLIIHGTEDEAVALREAKLVNKWVKTSKLIELEGANHVFGASHPFVENSLPMDLKKAKEAIVSFILANAQV